DLSVETLIGPRVSPNPDLRGHTAEAASTDAPTIEVGFGLSDLKASPQPLSRSSMYQRLTSTISGSWPLATASRHGVLHNGGLNQSRALLTTLSNRGVAAKDFRPLPLIERRAKNVPAGEAWMHEPKLDGYCLQVVTGLRCASTAAAAMTGATAWRPWPRLYR